MIKASARAHDGRHLVVLGLSEENIRRMRHGQPIYFETPHSGERNDWACRGVLRDNRRRVPANDPHAHRTDDTH
jgi:hypothetical protein